MERIAELLAKGIENLTAEELAELEGLCHAEAQTLLDEPEATDATLAGLAEIADHLDAVAVETNRRETEATERETRRQELADRIAGTQNAEGDDDAEGGEPAEGEGDPAEGEGEGEGSEGGETDETPAPEAEDAPTPVAASATPAPRISRVAARRPANHAPRPTGRTTQAALVASANVPDMPAGQRLRTADDVARAFTSAAELAASSSTKIKLPVAQMTVEIPEERMLRRDAFTNQRKLDAVTSHEAIVASGGICSPLQYRYDLPTVGDDARPVRDGLTKFGAERGGIRTMIPPTIADVGGAFGTWTEANDQNPSNPTTKPYLTIACDDDESSTRIYAITRSFKVGNFRDRWNPEQIAAYMKLANVYQARYAESKMLAAIATGSKAVTHGQLLGSAQDVFTSLRQLIVGIRYRHRIPRSQTFRVIGFEWVRDNIIADLIRKGPGDSTLEERLVMAESEVDSFFRALGVNITWSPDYQDGRTLGTAGGPYAGTQGVGVTIGYPSVARFYVSMEGSWLFLDGGELNLGVIRDTALVGTNDMLMFAETFENVHYHGLPGESYVLDVDICANGGIASALDINPCVSGS